MEAWQHGGGQRTLLEARTARAWGVPLSVVRGQRPPGEKWTYTDQVTALALTTYEASLCPGCGQPLVHSTGDHPRNYEVKTISCVGCNELETWTKELQPGERKYVVPEDD